MDQTPDVRHYTLIPKAEPRARAPGPVVRRFSLARVSPSPRSALGHDRHERMERAAGRGDHAP